MLGELFAWFCCITGNRNIHIIYRRHVDFHKTLERVSRLTVFEQAREGYVTLCKHYSIPKCIYKCFFYKEKCSPNALETDHWIYNGCNRTTKEAKRDRENNPGIQSTQKWEKINYAMFKVQNLLFLLIMKLLIWDIII